MQPQNPSPPSAPKPHKSKIPNLNPLINFTSHYWPHWSRLLTLNPYPKWYSCSSPQYIHSSPSRRLCSAPSRCWTLSKLTYIYIQFTLIFNYFIPRSRSTCPLFLPRCGWIQGMQVRSTINILFPKYFLSISLIFP